MTVLIDTSHTREIDRMDDPSQSMERIWTRVSSGNLFILNIMLDRSSFGPHHTLLFCSKCASYLNRLTFNRGERPKMTEDEVRLAVLETIVTDTNQKFWKRVVHWLEMGIQRRISAGF